MTDINSYGDFFSPSTFGSNGAGTPFSVHGGADLQPKTNNNMDPNNFGGSGKSFSELTAGTGIGGIAGLLGIGTADAAGNPDAANKIIAGGPDNAIANEFSMLIDGFDNTLARITIIILGFIFVAVGLSMFKAQGVALPGLP